MGIHGDRRIRRTHELLRAALLELVKEQGFEGLSVRQITDRANVGRTTFYAHFDGKEELLLAGFDDLHERLHRHGRVARAGMAGQPARPFGFGRELFEHVDEYREVFQAMVGRRSGEMAQARMKGLLVELVRNEVQRGPAPVRSGDLRREVLVQSIAGALSGLLDWWMRERPPLAPAEMDGAFRRMAESALRADQAAGM